MIPSNVRRDFKAIDIDIQNHPAYISLLKQYKKLEEDVNKIRRKEINLFLEEK